MTASHWFDFEVEAKPYTCSGGRIGQLPVILLCFAFWGRCPFHRVRSPDVAADRHTQFIGDTQNRGSCRPCYGCRTGSALVQAPSPASRSPRPFSGGYAPRWGATRSTWSASGSPILFGFCAQANPNTPAFDPVVYLAWGDVSIIGDNQVLRVFLKQSKMINGRSAEVSVGGTHDELCSFKAGRSYVAAPRGAVHRLAIQSRFV